MSVLLDALKKAAEEKRKRETEEKKQTSSASVAPPTEIAQQPDSTTPELPQTEVASSAIDLQLIGGVAEANSDKAAVKEAQAGPSIESVEPSPSTETSNTEAVTLNLVTSVAEPEVKTIDQVEGSMGSSKAENESVETTEYTAEEKPAAQREESIVELASAEAEAEAEANQAEDVVSEWTPEKRQPEESEQSISFVVPEIPASPAKDEEAEDAGKAEPVSFSFENLKMEQVVSEQPKTRDLEMALEADQTAPSVDLSEAVAQDLSRNEHDNEGHETRSEALNEDKKAAKTPPPPPLEVLDVPLEEEKSLDSAAQDWSLDQIPAYQKLSEAKEESSQQEILAGAEEGADDKGSKQKKMKRFLGVLASQKASRRRKRSFSNVALLSLFLVSIGLTVGYFGMTYYLSQEEAVDQSLRKYNIKPQISLKQPVNPLAQQQAAKNAKDEVPEDLEKKTESAKTEVDIVEPQPETDVPKETKKLVGKQAELAKKPAKSVTPEPVKEIKAVKTVKAKPVSPAKPKVVIKSQKPHEVLGYEAYQQGNWQAAKTHYLMSLQNNPEDVATLSGLGATSLKLGEQNQAKAYYQQAYQVDPENSKIRGMLVALNIEDMSAETLDDLKLQLQSDPKNDLIHFSIGSFYAKSKNWLSAQSAFQKAYQIAPNRIENALNLAISFDNTGDYAQAKRFYSEALALGGLENEFAVKERLITINQYLMSDF